jgi:microcystin-dependent protein
MKKTVGLIVMLCVGFVGLKAQVGIGNAVPDTNSILDLRNTNNRGFILPNAPGIMPSSPKGLMFFNQSENFIYYSDTGGYNALSAWRFKYNGTSSENAYYNFGGNVGIGLPDPQLKLHLKGNKYLLGIEGSSTAGIAFYREGYSIGLSSRIYQNSTGLDINNYETGDDIRLYVTGGGEVDVYGGNLNVDDGKVQEGGDDLIPYGVIVMWSGSTSKIPPGWALCNGSRGTPNLRNRFIVGAGDDYAVRSTGGKDRVTLKKQEIPEHHHALKDGIDGSTGETTSDGSHVHNYKDRYRTSNEDAVAGLNRNTLDNITTESKSTGSAGNHNHDLKGDSGDGSSDGLAGSSHENRPPYYGLAFIMKLKL